MPRYSNSGRSHPAPSPRQKRPALDGRTMADVYQWAHGIDDEQAERILTTHPGTSGGWLGPIREVRKPGRTADSIRMTVTRALAWLADPTVAAATMPGPDEGFDVAEFVSGRRYLRRPRLRYFPAVLTTYVHLPLHGGPEASLHYTVLPGDLCPSQTT